MATPQLSLTFVVQGTPCVLVCDLDEPLSELRNRALLAARFYETHAAGRVPLLHEWELRNAAGVRLRLDESPNRAGVEDGAVIYLSLPTDRRS